MPIKYSKELLQPIISKAVCWNDVCRALGLSPRGGSIKTFLKKKAQLFNLSYAHFLGKHKPKEDRSTPKEVLRNNSGFSRQTVRRKILESKVLPYKCAICELEPTWQGKPMTLILDHINGNRKDHRVSNLRFVCANCGVQLPTHAGANIGRW